MIPTGGSFLHIKRLRPGLVLFWSEPHAKNTIGRPGLLIVYFNLQQQDFTVRSSQERFQRGIIMTDS